MSDGVNVCRPNLRRAAVALGVRVGLLKRDDSAPNKSSAEARAGAGPARKPSLDGEHAATNASRARDARRALGHGRDPRPDMKNWIRLVLRGAGGRSDGTAAKAHYQRGAGKGPSIASPPATGVGSPDDLAVLFSPAPATLSSIPQHLQTALADR